MNMKNNTFNIIIISISVILIVFCSLICLNYMITYKYYIDENFDQKDLIYTYNSYKQEIHIILNYIKIFIIYLLIILLYFINHIIRKLQIENHINLKYKILTNTQETKKQTNGIKKLRNNMFNIIIMSISIILITVCCFAFRNYIIDYKHHIEENFDQNDIICTYNSCKIKMNIILIYLKFFIIYLVVIILYLINRIVKNNKKPLLPNESPCVVEQKKNNRNE